MDCIIHYCDILLITLQFVYAPKKSDEVHAYLRTVLASLYDDEVAQSTRIQYGGSVTPESVDELMSQPEIDGCLVGGKLLEMMPFSVFISLNTNVTVTKYLLSISNRRSKSHC